MFKKHFDEKNEQSLCLSCVWGFVRLGFRRDEVDIFCRHLAPNAKVPFGVRKCRGYEDRRVPAAPEPRRFGFVTEILALDEPEPKL